MTNYTTQKKIIGSRNVYDVDTGEEFKIPVTEVMKTNTNFYMTYTLNDGKLMLKPKDFSAADHQMLDYMCLLMDQSNSVYSTVTEIKDRLDMSTPTAYRSLSKLQEHDFIKRKGHNFYMINPEKHCKAGGDKREILLNEYLNIESSSKNQSGAC